MKALISSLGVYYSKATDIHASESKHLPWSVLEKSWKILLFWFSLF